MKRRLLVVMAVVAVVASLAAVPATAKGQLRGLNGDVDITLVLHTCPNEDAPGERITWVGTVDFGMRTVGIAYFPNVPNEVIGDKGWVFFDELWTLFRLPKRTLTDSVLSSAACNPKRVILEGIDRGFGTPWGVFFAAGPLIAGAGQFEKFVGGMAFWVGEVTSEGPLGPGSTFESHSLLEAIEELV